MQDNTTILEAEIRRAHDELDALRARAERAEANAAALRRALFRIEAHHVEQNRIKGRDESRSNTLRMVRAALTADHPGAALLEVAQAAAALVDANPEHDQAVDSAYAALVEAVKRWRAP